MMVDLDPMTLILQLDLFVVPKVKYVGQLIQKL